MKKAVKTMTVVVMFFIMTAGKSSSAQECDPRLIHVAALENKAVAQYDKFWGKPEKFGSTSAGILAQALLARTGAAVQLADESISPAAAGGDIRSRAKAILEGKRGCFVALGSVDSALVYAHNVYKFKPEISAGISSKRRDRDGDEEWYDHLAESFNPGHIRRKLKFVATSHLYLYDRRADALVVNMPLEGRHETSVKDYAATDKDKTITFSANPGEASGSPLGIPFLRMFGEFADNVKMKIK